VVPMHDLLTKLPLTEAVGRLSAGRVAAMSHELLVATLIDRFDPRPVTHLVILESPDVESRQEAMYVLVGPELPHRSLEQFRGYLLHTFDPAAAGLGRADLYPTCYAEFGGASCPTSTG
jgi:hypothetical protein